MGKYAKIIEKILSGRQDSSINFSELVNLLRLFGFSFRVKGSHHIFWRTGVNEIINIQPIGANAKPYQVKQIRNLIVKYRLGVEDE